MWEKEFTPLVYNAITDKFEFGKARKTNWDLWKQGVTNICPIASIVDQNM